MLAVLATVACSTWHFGLASAGPQEAPWAAEVVGSWAFVEPTTLSRGEPAASRDTAVWDIQRQGRLRRLQLRVRTGRSVAEEREIPGAWWWVKSRRDSGVMEHLLCWSVRPGRGLQCGRITLDTIATSDARPRTRMTWRGLTFKSQHWVFVRRAR